MTATFDYSLLDNPAATARSFHPRRLWTDTPPGAVDYAVTVADGVPLSARFFAVGRDNPTLLFFYGNGETVAAYDDIAPLYNAIGVNFFVADYRGYGASGGAPAFTALLNDARRLLDWLRNTMSELRFAGPLFVMGRSMGRHAAFELATAASDRISGVIIESGRPALGQFTLGQPPAAAQALEAAYRDKAASIAIPALVLHGQWDEAAPLADARGDVPQPAEPPQASGNYPRRRPQRPDVCGLPAVFRRHPAVYDAVRRAGNGGTPGRRIRRSRMSGAKSQEQKSGAKSAGAKAPARLSGRGDWR